MLLILLTCLIVYFSSLQCFSPYRTLYLSPEYILNFHASMIYRKQESASDSFKKLHSILFLCFKLYSIQEFSSESYMLYSIFFHYFNSPKISNKIIVSKSSSSFCNHYFIIVSTFNFLINILNVPVQRIF